MSEGRIRTGLDGYEHAAFNCISADSVARQIRRGLETDRHTWDAKPHGYWPSDCRWSVRAGSASAELQADIVNPAVRHPDL